MKCAILKQLQDPLAEELLRGGYKPHDTVRVDVGDAGVRRMGAGERTDAGADAHEGDRDGDGAVRVSRGGAEDPDSKCGCQK